MPPACFKRLFQVVQRVIQVLLFDMGFYGDVGVSSFCTKLFDDAQNYCKVHAMNLHMCKITKTLLGIKTSAEYPAGTLGFHSHLFVPCP